MLNQQRPLHREFIRFVVPSVVAQWVFALYAMVDGLFVARGVSEIALAAVNLALPFNNFIFALSLILAVGSSTIISIYFGQQRGADANRAYTQNLLTAVIISAVITAGVLFNLDAVARFLGSDASTHAYVKQYVGTVACFTVFFMLSYYFEILIKADGQPKLATILVAAGAVLNCILDYVAVFLLHWGVFGAALATGISQALVTVFFLVYFFGPRARLRLARGRPSGRLLWRTFKLGLPSGITDFSAGMMIFLFNHAILSHIGTEALVSYTIVAYVNTILVMSMTGIAQGMQPLVSYYYGQGKPAQYQRLLRYGLVAAAVVVLVLGLPTVLGAPFIVSLFISPNMAALRAYSTEVFRIFSLSFLFVGPNILLNGWFTAVEREKSAIAISLARGFVCIAAALWALGALFGGPGIWWAPTLSEAATLLLSLLLFAVYRRKAGAPAARLHGGAAPSRPA